MVSCGKGNLPGQSNKCSFIASVVECHACLLICLTQQFTDVAGVFCRGKFIFDTYAKQVMDEWRLKLGHSKSPDFNMCNYDDYLYETIYSM